MKVHDENEKSSLTLTEVAETLFTNIQEVCGLQWTSKAGKTQFSKTAK